MKYLTLLILLFSSFLCFAQKVIQQRVFLHFDLESEKTYLVEVNGEMVKEKYFTKGIHKNGEITFYIGKELFSSHTNKTDTCSIEKLKSIKISNLKNLKKEVNKINPSYPYKVYPNLYLAEKTADSKLVMYKVQWQYYIE